MLAIEVGEALDAIDAALSTLASWGANKSESASVSRLPLVTARLS